jgi:hypothetical protein
MGQIDPSASVTLADQHVKRNPPSFHPFEFQDIIDLYPPSSTPHTPSQTTSQWWWENVAAVASALPATVQHVRDAMNDAIDRVR